MRYQKIQFTFRPNNNWFRSSLSEALKFSLVSLNHSNICWTTDELWWSTVYSQPCRQPRFSRLISNETLIDTCMVQIQLWYCEIAVAVYCVPKQKIASKMLQVQHNQKYLQHLKSILLNLFPDNNLRVTNDPAARQKGYKTFSMLIWACNLSCS